MKIRQLGTSGPENEIIPSDDDLAEINKSLDSISLQGERYPASLAGLQGR